MRGRAPEIAAARHFRPGTPRNSSPGAVLTCLVLAPGPRELFAVDVDSGAYLRVELEPEGDRPASDSQESGFSGAHWRRDGQPEAGRPATDDPSDSTTVAESAGRTSQGSPLSVLDLVTLRLGPEIEWIDPVRPEAVLLDGPPRLLPPPKRRHVRRLLSRLPARQPTKALLGSLGSSVPYAELAGDCPSVELIRLEGEVVLTAEPIGADRLAVDCRFGSGGARHRLTCADQFGELLVGHRRSARRSDGPTGSALIDVLGFSPGYALLAFGAPEAGRVTKTVAGLLPVG